MAESASLPAGYPLYWPEEWPRTPSMTRRRSRYEVTFTQAREHAISGASKWAARGWQTASGRWGPQVVVSSNLALRLDGLPLAGAREPKEDPGVALWWIDSKKREVRVVACDMWRTTRRPMADCQFVCWDPDDSSEDEAKPAWKRAYDWQTAPFLSDQDFGRAAELFAARVHSDWDYPEEIEIFVKNAGTGEIRFVRVSSEPDVQFSAELDENESNARLLMYRFTALARAALEHRPRPWNWQQLRRERLHPEEAEAQRVARAKAAFERIDGRCPWPAGQAPKSWDLVSWPDWVPDQVRESVLGWSRLPSDYENTFLCNGVQPKLGEVVTFSPYGRNAEFVTGRYVGTYNQQGYCVTKDGTVYQGSALTCGPEKIAEMAAANRLARAREAVEAALKGASIEMLQRALHALSPAEVTAHG